MDVILFYVFDFGLLAFFRFTSRAEVPTRNDRENEEAVEERGKGNG